jgi:hypothetical protein
LEPDLDLTLGELEILGDFLPPFAIEISVVVELLLELEGLILGVGLSCALVAVLGGG